MTRRASSFLTTTCALIAGLVHSGGATAKSPDPTAPGVQPDAMMLQYPDISANQIVFVYGNDLWTVSRDGGVAAPLASPSGSESFPRFSPDGKTIAFVGNYEGNADIYTLPTAGGEAMRVTHHPASEVICDWSPDGRIIFFQGGLAGLARQQMLFTVPPGGGMPEQLPVPYGTTGAISPDGQWLAYTPHTTDFRTWKRYRGGMATDIWLLNLKDRASRKITDWEGTDTSPMWHGSTVYYLSDDGPSHRLNIWSYDTKSGNRAQVTTLAEYDVKWPSIGPGPSEKGEIIFQYGPRIQVLDLGTRQARTIDIRIPGDRPTLREKPVDYSKYISNATVSPTGKRVVVEARGDLFDLPAEKGVTRALTRTSGVAERYPSFSPDGKHVAYLSDESGEYELYIRPADGKGEPRRLTTDGSCWRYMRDWSPDSKRILFTDKTGALWMHTLGGEKSDGSTPGTTVLVARDEWAAQPQVSWSHDSGWIALSLSAENSQRTINIFEVATGTMTRVTDPMFNSTWPAFDRKGDWLYFVSNRIFQPTYADIDLSFVYRKSEQLYAMPLNKDAKSPLLARNDSEDDKDTHDNGDKKNGPDKEKKEGDAGKSDTPEKPDAGAPEGEKPKADNADAGAPKDDAKADTKEKPKEPMKIDFDFGGGLERRAVAVPVKPGGFFALAVLDNGKLIYLRAPSDDDGSETDDDGEPVGGGTLTLYDFLDTKADKNKEKSIAEGVSGYDLTAAGKKVLIRKGEDLYVADAEPDQKLEKKVPTDAMLGSVDPRAEWRQIFTEVWRMYRDFFYVPNMHGVDWAGVRTRYEPMLADCVTREDLNYVIKEVISELNVGHAYLGNPGDVEQPKPVGVGMLGCDWELAGDPGQRAYRIKRIHQGAAWDVDARGPLSQPGIDAKPGDYLLAVNGVSVDTSKDIWAAFVGLAGKTVALTLSDSPTLDDKSRDVIVKPVSSETSLRYRSWVERNRAYVEYKTAGKAGYIYVPNTGVEGQNELFRQFYGQRDKAGLIIDERWNGGGQIPTRFVELLNRPRTNYWARRDGKDWPWPPDSQQGPKVMLINGLAGSGGDMFPYLFRQMGVGKLIGMRTWGGLVGIGGKPPLIDGGSITVPDFGYYKKDGSWGIEGHGVDPDIMVLDDPAKMSPDFDVVADPQLDVAIQEVMTEIQQHPYTPPARPAPPDRSGMGIPDRDR